MSPATSLVAHAAIVMVASSVALAGCNTVESLTGKSSDESAESRDRSGTTRNDDPVAALPSATASASAAPTASAPGVALAGGLPPLDRRPLDLEKIKASKDADKAGDKLDEAKNHVAAEQEYRRSLELDPGNVFARYNVARSLVVQNKVSEGVAALATLKLDGCHLCNERILAASLRPDFKNAKADPAFVALTQDAHKTLFKIDVATKSIVKWFMTTPNAKLEPHEYIDPRSLVVIEDKTVGAKTRFAQLHGSEDFRNYVKEHYPKGIYPEGPRTCAKGCCDFTGSPILGVHLKRLCFKTSGTAAVHLRKITIEGNPGASFPG